MKEFFEYIQDPELVNKTLLKVAPYQVEPIEALAAQQLADGRDMLELAVELELEAIKRHQSRLNIVHEVLRVHHALPNEASPPINAKKAIGQGFAIGVMVAAKGYYFAPNPNDAKGEQRHKIEEARFKGYFRDIQPEALVPFAESDNLELELFLQKLDESTNSSTELLREALDFGLVIERGDSRQQKARQIGALTAYALVCHEKRRHRDAWQTEQRRQRRDTAKARKLAEAEAAIMSLPILAAKEKESSTSVIRRYIPFNLGMLQKIPMAIRREIEANRFQQEYWNRIKSRSSHFQKP